MAWIDVLVGVLIGLLIALALSRLFITRPKMTITFIIIFIIVGITISDDYLTPSDKRWNIIDKIRHLIQRDFQPKTPGNSAQ
jgi:high-affinity Fe2+/Pb2+ permease